MARKTRNGFRCGHQVGGARTLLAAVALLASLAAFAAPASAAEKGIETDMTWGVSNSDRDRTVADTKDLGAGWMRLTMAWADLEPNQKGSYAMLSHYDNAIAKAASSGAKIVVTVYTAPTWASGQTKKTSPPLNPADYADFIRFAAARWGSQVYAWEIWNEQNLWGFWSTGPSPGAYAQLLKAAYPAVKGADPSAPVVFGGTAYNDHRFIEAAYAAEPNLGQYFDVMATHPYTRPAYEPERVWYDSSGRIARESFAAYREVRSVMVANGDSHKPLWFTEFGWSTTSDPERGSTEAQQADFLTRAFRCMEQDPYIEVGIWYMLRNRYYMKDNDHWEDQLGLVKSDFTRKPAYAAFKNYTPGTGGCEYQYPAASPPPAPAPEPAPAPPPAPPTAGVAGPTEPVTPGAPSDETTDEAPDEDVEVAPTIGVRVVRLTQSLRVASIAGARRRSARVRVLGRVRGAKDGTVALRFTCRGRAGERVLRSKTRRVSVGGEGRFGRRVKVMRRANCRLRAVYRPSSSRPVESRLLRFRTN